LTTITTGSGVVTLPNPVLYSGAVQTFYNSTAGNVTLQTPSGVFNGPGASGTASLTFPAGAVITLVSDGTNYIAQSWLGGPISTTTITASGTITANSTVTFNPSNASISIQPTGTGTVTINPATAGSISNMSGSFTTISASGNVQFTATTASTAYNVGGALQVSGGVGIAGAVYTNSTASIGGALTVTTGGLTVSTGGASITGSTSILGALTVNLNTAGYPTINLNNTNTTSYGLMQFSDNGIEKAYFGMGGSSQTGLGTYAAYAQDGFSLNSDGAGRMTISNRGSSKTIWLCTGSESSSNFPTIVLNNTKVGINNISPSVSFDASANTDAIALPVGNNSNRPTGSGGYMRYNTASTSPEYYNGSAWISLGARDGTSASKAALKSTDILLYNSSAPTGWYWLQINGTATQVYIDNVYNGGGWVLVATHAFNISIPQLTYAQTTTGTTQLGSSGFTVGVGDPKQYTTFMPLRQWTYITTANAAGGNFVYFTAGSQVELGNTGAHSRRSRWTWTGWSSTYQWQGTSGLTNEVGGTTPGLWGTHIAQNLSWTTYDVDQDTYSGNCAQQYNNAPWWYDACWDGNFWGGNGNGYQNAAFWTGSGSDYYNYGAFYVK